MLTSNIRAHPLPFDVLTAEPIFDFSHVKYICNYCNQLIIMMKGEENEPVGG